MKYLLNAFVAAIFLLTVSFLWKQQPLTYPASYSPPLRSELIQAIHEAKQSIHLMIYSLTDPFVIQALNQQAEKGIYVEITCDRAASGGVHEALIKKIVTTYDSIEGLMHLKTLVIDKKFVWIGSANYSTASLQYYPNLVIALENAPLAEFLINQQVKYRSIGKLTALEKFEGISADIPFEFWLLPNNPLAIERLKKLLRSAQKSIKVAMFTWTRMDLAMEIADAHLRGVKVQVMLDRNAAFGAGYKVTQFLKRRNIPLKFGKKDLLLHHKLALIDDEILVTGSANWTKAAFTRNRDCFIILHRIPTNFQKEIQRFLEIN